MYSTPSAMFTVVRLVQPLKATAPMLVTVPSTSTLVIWSAWSAQGAGLSEVKLVIRPVPLMVRVPSARVQVTFSPQELSPAAAADAAVEAVLEAAEDALLPQPVRAMQLTARTAAAARLHRRVMVLRFIWVILFPISIFIASLPTTKLCAGQGQVPKQHYSTKPGKMEVPIWNFCILRRVPFLLAGTGAIFWQKSASSAKNIPARHLCAPGVRHKMYAVIPVV